MADDSAMKDIKDMKDMKFLQSIFSYIKDTRDFSQDILLEEMIQSESNEKLSDALNDMSYEIKSGFKDLSYAIKQQATYQKNLADNPIDASYVNLTEESMKDLVEIIPDYTVKTPIIVDEVDWSPKVSDSIYELLATQKEVKDLMIRQNTLPATMTDLESVSGIYYQKSMYYLMSISDYNERMLALMEKGGTTKGQSTMIGKSPKDDKEDTGFFGKGSLLDKILGFLELKGLASLGKKIFDKISGAFGFLLSPLQKGLNKLGVGFFKLILKFVKPFGMMSKIAKTAIRAIPGVGQIVTLALALFDFGKGIQNASEIVGKSKDKLTTLDKVNAGFSELISSLTLGFVDAKTIYKGVKWFENTMVDIFNVLMSMFPASVKKNIEKLWDAIFDENKGVFGSLVKSFKMIIDDISNGEYLKLLKDVLLSPFRFLVDMQVQMANMIKDGVTGLVGKDKLAIVKEVVGKALSSITDVILDLLKSVFSILPQDMQKFVSGGLGMIGDAAKGVGGFASDAVSWFTGEDDKKPKQVQPIKNGVAKVNAIPAPIGAQKTTQLTQDKENAKRNVQVNTPAPVVNVMPPKQQPKIERRARAGSETILHMNSALGRP